MSHRVYVYPFDESYAGTVNDEPSMTIQAPAVDCDINVLMDRMGVTNARIPAVDISSDVFDYSDVPDLRTVLDRVRAAEDAFAEMPARIRSRFNNDPVAFLEFMQTDGNQDEAVALGIVQRKPSADKAEGSVSS